MRTRIPLKRYNSSFMNASNFPKWENKRSEILVIATYPPRECGIATYSQDLILALNNKFEKSFTIKVCALENESEKHKYANDVEYVLETDKSDSYSVLAKRINENEAIKMVLLQHEFGLFRDNESDLIALLQNTNKAKIIAFHTVLPNPNETLKDNVQQISNASDSIIVMTKASAKILVDDYDIAVEKIAIIPHGTHLVEYTEKKNTK
jgi:hypothetical protein